mmetsp:Transcript_91010/g.283552  ORF Transcript_91010/g.283552 Transcript_91010/m.283552 type:complete len:309 (+) Transcript_91010:245-1171(+)
MSANTSLCLLETPAILESTFKAMSTMGLAMPSTQKSSNSAACASMGGMTAVKVARGMTTRSARKAASQRWSMMDTNALSVLQSDMRSRSLSPLMARKPNESRHDHTIEQTYSKQYMVVTKMPEDEANSKDRRTAPALPPTNGWSSWLVLRTARQWAAMVDIQKPRCAPARQRDALFHAFAASACCWAGRIWLRYDMASMRDICTSPGTHRSPPSAKRNSSSHKNNETRRILEDSTSAPVRSPPICPERPAAARMAAARQDKQPKDSSPVQACWRSGNPSGPSGPGSGAGAPTCAGQGKTPQARIPNAP